MYFLKFFLILTLLISACSKATPKQSEVCSPLDYDKAQLMELRVIKFELSNDIKRNDFARGLIACLGNPDPELRDKIAYEGLSQLLRSGKISDEVVLELRADLIALLKEPDLTDDGFVKPFAALALSEVVRVDRKTPLFTSLQRIETVNAVSTYMRSIADYRGYDSAQGWRHGVAHTADILMQLSLNPKLEREQLEVIRDAVFSQLVPKNDHFYIYGEPERLARPIFYLAARGEFTAEEWTEWFSKISDPAPFESWNNVYTSETGLAKLHNTRAFINTIYGNSINSQNPNVQALAEPALNVLRELP